MNAVADCKDTMMTMIHELHEKYVIAREQQYLIIESDARDSKVLKT